MKKKLTAALLAMVMTLSLAACAAEEAVEEEKADAGVAVQVVEISSDTIATENKVVGKLSAENEETIMVGSAAKCTAVYKNAGDSVEAGEKIATLDLGSTIANYNAAKIGYNSAVQSYNDQKSILSKQVKLAEDNVANTKALFEIGAASQLEVDNAQISYESAVAGMNSALAQLESAIQSAKSGLEQLGLVMDNVDLNGNIISPISGTLATLNVSEGGFASTSLPVAVITGAEQMKITTSVSEALVPQLQSGDEATVYVSSADQTFTATIRSVDRAANYQTQLYTVVLTVPADVTGLTSGASAEVTFHTNVSENTIVIPTEAILTGTDGQYVFVAENGAARRCPITTGLTGSGVTEVLTGLNEGEMLVTVGQAYLVEGSAVRVVGGE
ncbi:MAG: efflux RND transporter periplasmic adaptor subunit [Oscillibacter sp.]|nr:efflux RND transporter periplasmic adaptor subunit [Oscillibacter sp.]